MRCRLDGAANPCDEIEAACLHGSITASIQEPAALVCLVQATYCGAARGSAKSLTTQHIAGPSRRGWLLMLRKALVLGLALGSGLAEPLVATAAGSFFAEEPPAIAGAPFSAVVKTQSVTTFADGNRIVRGNTVYYFRDGQGRTRTERGEGPSKLITITDPVSAERFVVRPGNKSFFAYKAPAGRMVPPVVPSSDDDMAPFALLGFRMGIGASPATEASAATTSLGQKSFNGVAATGTRLVRDIPTGVLGNEKPITSTLDRWVSADLGIPVAITQTSSLGGELTLSLQQVARTEQDPTLFVPPADYNRRDINLPAAVASLPGASVTSVSTLRKSP